MLAAKKSTTIFQAVTYDMRPAMRAGRCQRADRTFEAVEEVTFSIHSHLEAFVIVVSARLANRHDVTSIFGLGTFLRGMPGDPGLADVVIDSNQWIMRAISVSYPGRNSTFL
jgi:hypothetical protein